MHYWLLVSTWLRGMLTFITFVAHVVFNAFSQHGYCQHEDEWQDGSYGIEWTDGRDRLKHSNEQEINVSETFKL